jgi:hypothetical protein
MRLKVVDETRVNESRNASENVCSHGEIKNTSKGDFFAFGNMCHVMIPHVSLKQTDTQSSRTPSFVANSVFYSISVSKNQLYFYFKYRSQYSELRRHFQAILA